MSDSHGWPQWQASLSTTLKGGNSSVDYDDAMYGERPKGLSAGTNSDNVFDKAVDEVSGSHGVSDLIGESVQTDVDNDERGRSVSSSDLDSMDPLLLGIRKQASQTDTTPHPSLEVIHITHSGESLDPKTHNQAKEARPPTNYNEQNKQKKKDSDKVRKDKDIDKVQKDTPLESMHTSKDMQEMKEKVSSIIHELKSMTAEFRHSRNATQKALDDTKSETQKTQSTVGKTQVAVDNLHKVIGQNQDKTQQAFQNTHKNIATLQSQVTQTLGTVQEMKQDVNRLKTQVEANTEGVKTNKTDIQTNKEDLQQMKDDIKRLQDKQEEHAGLHKCQDEQNERMDRHMDRQEVVNRRSNFVIFGVQETTGRRRENTEEIVIDVLQTFMPDGDWQPSDCVTAYRAGRRDDSNRGDERQARPIVATLDRPSDVGFILRHRQGRDEMRKVGLGCAQDLSRAQQQKIRDIKQDGKQAYYFKGRLVVRDNPYDRSRNRNKFGNNRIRQDNRQGSDLQELQRPHPHNKKHW